MAIKKRKISRTKLGYYAKNLLRQLVPGFLYTLQFKKKLSVINKYDNIYLSSRVNYYNKLTGQTDLGDGTIDLGNMKIFKSPKAYNFDTFEYSRYFNEALRANFVFGDAIHVGPEPTIQKSRPVAGDNQNAVLLNLDKQRHFVFVKDPYPFADKKDILIGRGVMTQPHRIRFMEKYFGNPCCDLGQVNLQGGNHKWYKPKLPIEEHLKFKFILSLEGNDVATNLKWIMSSNSIAVMPKPKYETWFMEGRLKGGIHYIEIKDNYTDLIEKLTWYLEHEHEALKIIKNANAYVRQFFNKEREDLISLLVLEKYFYNTGQLGRYSLQ